MPFRVALLALLAVSVTSCDSKPAPVGPPLEAVGQLTYAVGVDVRQIPFSDVNCVQESDGVVLVELLYNRVIAGPQGEPQRPRILIARFRGGEVLEASAFAPGAEHDGKLYAMLQMIGDGCRLDAKTLVCNETQVIPWLGAGERPRPSFKVEIGCL